MKPYVLAIIYSLTAACGWCLATPLQAAEPHAADLEFFETKIRPVLVKHCYECHSAETKSPKGGLLLDTRAAIRQGGESGPSVVPGDTAASLILEALRYESYEMPPKGKLPDSVIADFETWIRRGAADPREGGKTIAKSGYDWDEVRQFWSYRPVVEPALPAVKNAAWPASDIDRFILAGLEAKGLAPAAAADRRTLLRRAYFDLIGLPPSPEEIEAFLADDRPDAYERLVDRLLASPQFGERWGRHWLDVVRYADSAGGGRTTIFANAWRYRDYVVASFNRDKPIDQFITEQLAGDLLPHASAAEEAEHLTATGFYQLGPKNLDTQDKELLRMDVIDEQLDTLGRAFLGMTMGCARCHDHKFDPIPTADYYAMAGILRSTKTLLPGNVSGFVQRPLPLDESTRVVLESYTQKVDEITSALKTAQAAEKKLQARRAPPQGPGREMGIVIDDAEAKVVGDWKSSTFSPTRVGPVYLHDERSGKGEKSITFEAKLPKAGSYEVLIAYNHAPSRASNVPVTVKQQNQETVVIVNQQSAPTVEKLYESLGQFKFAAGLAAVIVGTRDTNGYVIADAVQFVPLDGKSRSSQDDIAQPAEKPDPAADVLAELAAVQDRMQALEAELARLKKSAPPPAPMTLSVEDEAKTGDYYVCIRGNVHQLGQQEPRGFLRVITPEKPEIAPDASGRLELARWIASNDNPLTARVYVNRIWQHLMGRGIVATPDSFGTTGDRPSHPELLDGLVLRFQRGGWSQKTLIKAIMLSQSYRMQSDRNPRAEAIDPENRLWWRMPRRRLEVEAIRDSMLLASGELDLAIGGSTVPTNLGNEFDFKYDSRRRTIYLPILRNGLFDMFEVFDFADPNMVHGRRNVSVLATQALYFMNSPFVHGRSAAAADRLLAIPNLTDDARLEQAYLQTLGRLPRASEIAAAKAFLDAAGEPTGKSTRADRQRSAWQGIYKALFGSLDFRYVY